MLLTTRCIANDGHYIKTVDISDNGSTIVFLISPCQKTHLDISILANVNFQLEENYSIIVVCFVKRNSVCHTSVLGVGGGER